MVTLGCARNEVDSDQLAGLLARSGHRLVAEAVGADAILVNTCTFIDPATEESIETVLAACDLKGSGPRAVVVVGCMAERYREELADSLPEVDAVLGFGAYPRLPAVLDALLEGRAVPRFLGYDTATPATLEGTPRDDLDRIPTTGPRLPLRSAPDRPWAYLKVASGCDRACTFCAIPSWRGGFRSRPFDEVVDEARWLVGGGARELVLVSENTTSWGKELPGGREVNQPRLLSTLAGIDGLERIRLVYLQPDELRAELIDAMVDIPEVASYFDLSLQHASASVLERMARAGSRERFLDLIAAIRHRDAGAVFRSNFIVGFPGETPDDVTELGAFLAEARLDWVGLFAFSPQDGTRAPEMTDQVPELEAAGRLRELTDLQEAVADDAARAFVGRRLSVILDEDAEDGPVGRSYREAPETDGEIRLVDPEGAPLSLPPGRTTDATVIDAIGVDLVAVPDLPAEPRAGGARPLRTHLPLVGQGPGLA
jgi:ribosomal protein S12 methylthiotransferase